METIRGRFPFVVNRVADAVLVAGLVDFGI